MSAFLTFLDLLLSVSLKLIVPLVVFARYRRDWLLPVYALLSLFTMNTLLMAVIRECGGMDFLKELGRQPWFKFQYSISYYCYLAAEVVLLIFLVRLWRSRTRPQ